MNAAFTTNMGNRDKKVKTFYKHTSSTGKFHVTDPREIVTLKHQKYITSIVLFASPIYAP